MSAGQDLAAGFYRDVVARLVDVAHAAALVGEGSEVLGFDDQRSTDHAWGPRMHLFVDAAQVVRTRDRVTGGLPETYRSRPVEFYAWQDRMVRHHVVVTSVEQWLPVELGQPEPTSPAAWLGLPQQRLLQVSAGVVFHDDMGDLTQARRRLAYYPDDVWWWMQASQWQRLAGAEALPGRLAEAGDDRGAALAASHIATLLIELAFLQRRRYWPYPKWLGTAFQRLEGTATLGQRLDHLIAPTQPDQREAALAAALQAAAEQHNQLDPDRALDPTCRPFEVGISDARRPYRVLNAGRFATACLDRVSDPGLRRLAPVGAIDQLTHASDLLANFSAWPSTITRAYADLLLG